MGSGVAKKTRLRGTCSATRRIRTPSVVPAVRHLTERIGRLTDTVVTIDARIGPSADAQRLIGQLTERVERLTEDRATLIRWLLNARRELRDERARDAMTLRAWLNGAGMAIRET